MCIARPRHHRFEISNRKFQFPAISRTVGAQWNKHRLSSYGNRRIERYEKSEKIIQRYYMFLGCIKLIFLFHASSNLFFFFPFKFFLDSLEQGLLVCVSLNVFCFFSRGTPCCRTTSPCFPQWIFHSRRLWMKNTEKLRAAWRGSVKGQLY